MYPGITKLAELIVLTAKNVSEKTSGYELLRWSYRSSCVCRI